MYVKHLIQHLIHSRQSVLGNYYHLYCCWKKPVYPFTPCMGTGPWELQVPYTASHGKVSRVISPDQPLMPWTNAFFFFFFTSIQVGAWWMGLSPVSYYWLLRLPGAGAVNRSYEQQLSEGKKGEGWREGTVLSDRLAVLRTRGQGEGTWAWDWKGMEGWRKLLGCTTLLAPRSFPLRMPLLCSGWRGKQGRSL